MSATPMTEAEAERYGIPEDERYRYFRYDTNSWFRITWVKGANGDPVSVAQLWTPIEYH